MPKVVKLGNNPLETLVKIEEESKKTLVPAGYIPVELSTKGLVGAPKIFHIRNFTTKDIMDLAITPEDDLPTRIVYMLNSMIFEDDVDVSDFHENEVVETIIELYKTFYSPMLPDVAFPIEDSDYEWLRAHNTEQEYLNKKQSLENGSWVPRFDIDLQKLNKFKIDPSSFSSKATVKNNKTGFSITFGLPKFGDSIIIKKWLEEEYGAKERTFAHTKRMVELRDSIIDEFKAGVAVDLTKLPYVDPEKEKEWFELQREKSLLLMDVIRALHLQKIDGQDVSELPIKERIELLQDPRIDIALTKKLDNYFDSLKFGINNNLEIVNPITKEMCVRKYPFRFLDILQAVQVSEADGYDIVFDE